MHRSEPVRLLALPPETSSSIARTLAAKKLREAPWSIKRLMNYCLCYKFLQKHVVQPAFEIKASGAVTPDAIQRQIGDRYRAIPILPRSLPDITVDLTELVGHHTLHTQNTPGMPDEHNPYTCMSLTQQPLLPCLMILLPGPVC